jgi:hypothetical protein
VAKFKRQETFNGKLKIIGQTYFVIFGGWDLKTNL